MANRWKTDCTDLLDQLTDDQLEKLKYPRGAFGKPFSVATSERFKKGKFFADLAPVETKWETNIHLDVSKAGLFGPKPALKGYSNKRELAEDIIRMAKMPGILKLPSVHSGQILGPVDYTGKSGVQQFIKNVKQKQREQEEKETRAKIPTTPPNPDPEYFELRKVGDTKIEATYTQPEDVDIYRYHYCQEGTNKWKVIDVHAPDRTTIITGLEPGATYVIQLEFVNTLGEKEKASAKFVQDRISLPDEQIKDQTNKSADQRSGTTETDGGAQGTPTTKVIVKGPARGKRAQKQPTTGIVNWMQENPLLTAGIAGGAIGLVVLLITRSEK